MWWIKKITYKLNRHHIIFTSRDPTNYQDRSFQLSALSACQVTPVSLQTGDTRPQTESQLTPWERAVRNIMTFLYIIFLYLYIFYSSWYKRTFQRNTGDIIILCELVITRVNKHLGQLECEIELIFLTHKGIFNMEGYCMWRFEKSRRYFRFINDHSAGGKSYT